jgi:hypothetical protein
LDCFRSSAIASLFPHMWVLPGGRSPPAPVLEHQSPPRLGIATRAKPETT